MGKYLIIKDADFSANAVEKINPGGTSYFYGITDEQFMALFNTNINITSSGFTDKGSKSGLRGLNLVGIRARIREIGTLTFIKTNFDVVGGVEVDSTMINELFTVNVTKTGIQDIMFPNTVVLGENECLAIGKTSDTARFMYSKAGSGQPFYQFFTRVRDGGTTTTANGMLGVDFIYR